ncbi:hypothetical protein CCHR01_17476 [Colletotrichum chrysophilum]|uniref:Uncharacterized protein n=1 Tax=Colletotrichum chrysophilum TaxID=1836956 RepID=A0AAD9ECF7_9PEZI|nr:hypothetical protein CCHR01_17476 [Colletotrichum chrysophilum]
MRHSTAAIAATGQSVATASNPFISCPRQGQASQPGGLGVSTTLEIGPRATPSSRNGGRSPTMWPKIPWSTLLVSVVLAALRHPRQTSDGMVANPSVYLSANTKHSSEKEARDTDFSTPPPSARQTNHDARPIAFFTTRSWQ